MNTAIALVLASCVLRGVGAAFQKQSVALAFPKLSLGELGERLGEVTHALAVSAPWLVGLCLWVLGGVFFVSSLGSADLTVVAGIGNLTTVVSLVIGVLVLREAIQPGEWLALLLLVAGAVVLTSDGGSSSELRASAVASWGIGIVGLVLAVITALVARFRAPLVREVALSIGAGCQFGIANLYGKTWMQPSLSEPTWMAQLWPPACFFLFASLAFVMLQLAYANGRVGVVTSLVAVANTLVSAATGVTLLGEAVGPMRLAGVSTVIVGMLLLGASYIWEARRYPSADPVLVGSSQ